MGKTGMPKNKRLELAIRDILKSQSQSRIYLYLLRKNEAKTEDIIKGTHLHPSTVRETLAKMYSAKLIFRKKLKNDNIGKNPFLYYPLPPLDLIKRYASEIEDRLNNIASFASQKAPVEESFRPVKIKISNRDEIK
jgi:predicted transcriptional regulator